MIEFQEIEAQNLLSIQSSGPIPLRPGVTLIRGCNLDSATADSSGSGKSAVIEIIPAVLFGRTLRGLKGSDLVREGSSGFYGRVQLSVNGQETLVQRWIDHKEHGTKLELSIAGQKKANKQNKRDTQQVLESMLGFDWDTFTALDSLSPGLQMFLDLPDIKRESILEDLLGIGEISDAKDRVKGDLDKLNGQVIASNKRVELAESSQRRIAWTLQEFATQAQAHDEQRTRRIEALRRDLDSTELRLVQLSSNLYETEQTLATVKIAALDAAALIAPAEAASKEADAILARGRSALLEASSTLKGEQGTRRALAARIEGVEALDTTLPCPKCLRPVSQGDIGEAIAHEKEELTILDEVIAALLADESDVRAVLTENEIAYRVARAALDQAKATLNAATQATTLADSAARLARSQRDSTAKDRDRIVANLAAPDEDSTSIRRLLLAQEQQLDAATKESAEAQTESEVLAAQVPYLAYWVEAFGAKGLPSYLMDCVVPEMTAKAQAVLSRIADGFQTIFSTTREQKSGKIENRLTVEVNRPGGAQSYQACSSGERRRVSLGATLAFRNLRGISRPAHNLICIDEVLDPLDGSGIEAVLSYLREVEIPRGLCVLLISHHSALADISGNTITATRQGDVTTLELTA